MLDYKRIGAIRVKLLVFLRLSLMPPTLVQFRLQFSRAEADCQSKFLGTVKSGAIRGMCGSFYEIPQSDPKLANFPREFLGAQK